MTPRFFTTLDWVVLVAYFVGMLGLGVYFNRRNRSSDDFTAGGRSLSGWLCGLSIFATYLSSISYLALPGSAFLENWNGFVFSLALPIAAWIASVWFVPYYRRTGEVSAYAMLEHRFGVWARTFASTFYLLFQVARMGVVIYLMGLPLAVIFGWDLRTIILLTGVAVTVYAFIGGIIAVIWADAIQAVVLVIGAVVALAVILSGIPDGLEGVLEIAKRDRKFSFGSTELTNLSEKTVWVVFAYGVMENIKNFGIDQSYIQRYIASRDLREARKSVWLGGVLYLPISGLFFFIGTSLYAYYETHPQELDEVRRIVATQNLMQQGIEPPSIEAPTPASTQDPPPANDASPGLAAVEANAFEKLLGEELATLEDSKIGDRVFPHFIAAHLPPGVTGMLVAAIFAAAMSTVSTSLNSSATLVMSDFYRRFFNAEAGDRALMRCLHVATVVWGCLGTGMALLLVPLTQNALDIWWTLSSVLGAGIVGLFLLGVISRRATAQDAQIAVAAGIAVIAWMILSKTAAWPEGLSFMASGLHEFLVIVVGTFVILGVGYVLALRHRTASQHPPHDRDDPT